MNTNPTFEEDFRFVFAKSGKARAPRSGSAKPGGGSAGGGSREQSTPAAVRGKVLNAVRGKPQVMVKITSYGKSSQAVKDHVDYISRKGENDVFDAQGENLSEFAQRAGLDTREALEDVAADMAAAQECQRGDGSEKKGGRRRERVTMNLMLSMPPGTDTGAFELSVRDFLGDQFRNNEHMFTFHDDRDHYHAHIVVGLQGHDGKWLNPRKADLQEWRENFAASLERHGIEAGATSAYSRGRGKGGYRRDIEEPRKRGTGRRSARSETFDAEAEGAAIERHAAAWSRIGDHYARAGDREAADAIKEYVADRFDHHPAAAPTKAEALEHPSPERQAPAPVEVREHSERPAAAPATAKTPEAAAPKALEVEQDRPAAAPAPKARPRQRERSSDDRER